MVEVAGPPLMRNNGTNILDRIVQARRESVARRKGALPDVALRMAVDKTGPPRDFAGVLERGDRFNVIAELKKASPSRGTIRTEYAPAALASALEAAGAAALSVLTEENFFSGSLGDLKAARAATHSFLLIVAIVQDPELGEFIELGRKLGMEPLVEVHSREELDRALGAGARIVGINNRDLGSFEVRRETSLDLVEAIPDGSIAVSESGLGTHDDLVRLRSAGFDAFLVGERLMKETDPPAALRELMGALGAGRTRA
jgi:indole-3-glycerol phosphate synthase